MSASLDRLDVHFEQLRLLADADRAAAIAALDLTCGERDLLARLLAADACDDDPLERAVTEEARRLHGTRDERLGPWRLVREIGSGGMGTVFLAERADGGFEQRVAIKLLRGFPTAEGVRRLRQERQILAGLDHPHIARLLDGGETADGQPWLAMEYVEGVALLAHVRQSAPALNQRLALFHAMLDAVEHAHQRLIIHRDIKPANVLVARNGAVKLLDFGIAKLAETDAMALRETSTQVYSRGYASPEQREGRAITTASDIYSLGVMLRVLVSGRRDAESREPEVSALPMDIELGGIVAKACAEDPQQRYASAGEFRDDLVRYREGRPVRAAALSRRYQLRKFIGRHRLGTASVVVAVLALGAFVWSLERERARALSAEFQAQRALEVAERNAASARASLDFLTDAFAAAAPEQAMSRQVGVRDLLDAARARLAERRSGDVVLEQTMQRMLARLYSRLGESGIAVELMRLGLADLEPRDDAEALRLADDYEEYSSQLGLTGDAAGSLAAAQRAAKWRADLAPGDTLRRIRSLQTLGMAQHRAGADDKAIPLLREALDLAATNGVSDVDAVIETAQILASLLATRRDCTQALETVDAGQRRADAELPALAPQRVVLLRSRAAAMNACGRPAEAEPLLRAAIELQDRVVGPGGSRMMALTSDLAITLNDLGRYQEAVATLGASDRIMRSIGLAGADEAVSHTNLAGILENAGDYDGALRAYALAVSAIDDAGFEADHGVRRHIERAEARTLGIVGRHAEALERLDDLRLRCARTEGEDSGEYAMLTWQLALLAMRMRQPESGIRLLAEAEQRFGALVPADHLVFMHARRVRAAFALQQGDPDAAVRELRAATAEFARAGSLPVDLAIAQSELAEALTRGGRIAPARELLGAALPVLRQSVLPTEINRIAAERTAQRLGGIP